MDASKTNANICHILPSAKTKPLAAAIATCFAFSATPVFAAPTVTNTDNSGPGSLRQAIIDSNGNNTADTIDFASALSGETITLALPLGQINITDTAALTIDASALADGITISGNNASRIFGVTRDQRLTLNNLTITQGRTTATSRTSADCDISLAPDFTHGGAICAEGSLTLIDSAISNSSTTGESASGGGFFALGSTTLTNSRVSGNSTTGNYAGGGGFYTLGSATLTNSTVSGNSTAGGGANGGGFYAGDYSASTLINSTVSGNSTTGESALGGGFFALGSTILTNSTVSGNSTMGNYAGGGGFYTRNVATLTNSTVSGNNTEGRDADGGGFYTLGSTILTNSTVSGNSAMGNYAGGGGFFAVDHAGAGSTLNSSVVAGNGADNIAGSNNAIFNASFSLLGAEVASELQAAAPSNAFNNAPGLAGLADNGCATSAGAAATAACVQTRSLLTGSPAIDAGQTNGLPTDQRGTGFPRVLNGQADIGAFEGQIAATPGDCSGDGAVNIQDVACTISTALGDGIAEYGANCDESVGLVDTQDVICTINKVLNP